MECNTKHEILKEICYGRYSRRSYSDKTVSEENIEKIKTIATTTPYASGRKNWELLVITERSLIKEIAAVTSGKIRRLQTKVKEDFEEYFRSYSENFLFFEKAPLVMIPLFHISTGLTSLFKEHHEGIAQWESDNYVKSISCVALLVLLAAESLGLGGCYMTGPLLAETEIAATLKIKSGRRIGALIPIGYAPEGDK